MTDSDRSILQAPLNVPDAVHQVGRALFLYTWLITQANAKGLVCRESGTIAKALEAPEDEVISWSERLAACRLIEVLALPPHFVIKLPLWSGSGLVVTPKPAEKLEKIVLPNRDIGKSLLKLKQTSSEAKQEATDEVSLSINVGDRGAGKGGSDLLAEVRAVIGDHEGIPEILRRYPESMIRTALAKTRATPQDQIKKSRAALFWFLIGKTSK